SPESQPVPATPVPPAPQNQFLTLAPAALAWVLPTTTVLEFAPFISSPLMAERPPLYARDCAFLI
ncbi:MAG TPA: hypothetical protein VKU37_06050, partial [Verrucomicrobiae bacterium]|nr:hypothetical protein [Verrucomicrobiae bacterium]